MKNLPPIPTSCYLCQKEIIKYPYIWGGKLMYDLYFCSSSLIDNADCRSQVIDCYYQSHYRLRIDNYKNGGYDEAIRFDKCSIINSETPDGRWHYIIEGKDLIYRKDDGGRIFVLSRDDIKNFLLLL